MQISDLFLFPSLFEGLGIVLIEAQAAGVPCLVSDTVPPIVDCGGCKFFSIEKQSFEWAKQMELIIDKKTKVTIDEDLLQAFSIEHMVKQMETLFS